MLRKQQATGAQLGTGESRDSGFDAEPVIGRREGADPVASPRNDSISGVFRLAPRLLCG